MPSLVPGIQFHSTHMFFKWKKNYHCAIRKKRGKAPGFEAESTMGHVKLSDYIGKKNVLLVDAGKSIQPQYRTGRISFVIDKEGVILYIEKGMPDNQRILKKIDELFH